MQKSITATQKVEIQTGYINKNGMTVSYYYEPKAGAKNNVKWLKENYKKKAVTTND